RAASVPADRRRPTLRKHVIKEVSCPQRGHQLIKIVNAAVADFLSGKGLHLHGQVNGSRN
ncbi:MAG: hypothetical protein KDD53_13215, partial [Bdellovibrionales bacterium]|nr:hypothetical protein [Bdellovibrionales bacterium]